MSEVKVLRQFRILSSIKGESKMVESAADSWGQLLEEKSEIRGLIPKNNFKVFIKNTATWIENDDSKFPCGTEQVILMVTPIKTKSGADAFDESYLEEIAAVPAKRILMMAQITQKVAEDLLAKSAINVSLDEEVVAVTKPSYTTTTTEVKQVVATQEEVKLVSAPTVTFESTYEVFRQLAKEANINFVGRTKEALWNALVDAGVVTGSKVLAKDKRTKVAKSKAKKPVAKKAVVKKAVVKKKSPVTTTPSNDVAVDNMAALSDEELMKEMSGLNFGANV